MSNHNTLAINVGIGETRVALIEEGFLAELYVERQSERSPVGNVYLGKVTRVLPGMQAAFIDVGLDRAAFLHVEDLIPEGSLEKLESGESPASEENGDATEEGSSSKRKLQRLTRKTPIREVLSEGQEIVVQVSKAPISTKGARVTSHVSLPGRYVVYLPTVDHIGVSKRIGNDEERKRLRESIEALKPPVGGLIVRTVGAGLTKKRLKADVGYLVKTWESVVEAKSKSKRAPALLYSDLDIVLRAARDLFTEEVGKLIVDSPEAHKRLLEFMQAFMPERMGDVEVYKDKEPIFDAYGIEDEISRALSRKVQLPSGGYLIIDQAEALTAIDVNTGRFTGKGRDVEETILQTNLEAAKEIAYQLRFRNIGGLIVLDFIDMERKSHRDKVNRALSKFLKRDRSKTTTIRISELGLVEMTRKRTRESLGRTLHEACFYCDGTGHLLSKTSICHEIVRQIGREKDGIPGYKIVIHAHPAICDRLAREEKSAIEFVSKKHSRQIETKAHTDYHLEQFHLSGS
ncbi:MAG: Rne/Rng family ribonuclease [Myxococcales bacterium]|nr:MAG: Rne/Rng family ribonuclease [Myxococcales bacterium]